MKYLKITLFIVLILKISLFSQKTYVIKVNDNGYDPDKISINIGDQVIWQWQAGIHTTTSSRNENNEGWDVPINILNPVYTKTFNSPGEYKYSCKFHKKHKGNIVVLDPVPVELTLFRAELKNKDILIIWQTATETNNLGFEIDRMSDDENWRMIGFLSGNGTTSLVHDYQFEDKDVIDNIKYYYRLKQIDFDGSFNYSNVLNIERKSSASVELFQNFPNPFNPVTTIKYFLNEASFVQIKIYNSLGSEIAVLENENKTPGKYELKFDGSNVSSGIYFLKMNAGDYKNTIKMILIR